jgi:hypothetical protein
VFKVRLEAQKLKNSTKKEIVAIKTGLNLAQLLHQSVDQHILHCELKTSIKFFNIGAYRWQVQIRMTQKQL